MGDQKENIDAELWTMDADKFDAEMDGGVVLEEPGGGLVEAAAAVPKSGVSVGEVIEGDEGDGDGDGEEDAYASEGDNKEEYAEWEGYEQKV